MKANQAHHAVAAMCRLLGVSDLFTQYACDHNGCAHSPIRCGGGESQLRDSRRKGSRTGVAAVFALAGVTEGSELRRHLEYLGWRLIEDVSERHEDPGEAS